MTTKTAAKTETITLSPETIKDMLALIHRRLEALPPTRDRDRLVETTRWLPSAIERRLEIEARKAATKGGAK